MIRKLLTLIDQGSMTMGEMAVEMDMSEADLKGRMEMMVRMGQLEAITIDEGSPDPEGDCPGCVMAARCREEVCSDGPVVVGYRMTEKGRRIVHGPGNGRGGTSE